METQKDSRLMLKLTGLFCTALLFLAVFQSSALLSLSYDLPPSGPSQLIVVAIEQWHAWMETLGAAGLTESVGEWMENLREIPVAN